jgi:copper(I)-binding protein
VIRSPIRCTLLPAAALGVMMGLLSGCGAGQITQTEDQQPPVPGVNLDSPDGRISLRDLAVEYRDPKGYPQGGTAPLRVLIFNRGTTPVRLVAVTSDAGSVVVSGPSAAPSPSPSPSAPPTSPTVSPSNGRSPGGSPTGTASPTPPPSPVSPSPSPTPAGNPQVNVEIPVNGFVSLVPNQPRYLQITGLTRPLRAADVVKMTFRFDDGTTLETDVPMNVPGSPLPRTPLEFDEEEPGH